MNPLSRGSHPLRTRYVAVRYPNFNLPQQVHDLLRCMLPSLVP
jgi:hypothetical protein